MAEAQVNFAIEPIPDSDFVFMRAHKERMKTGSPSASVFTPHGDGMSVDWDKYSTAEDTQARGKTPTDNAVISLGVGDIREISYGLDVIHDPLPNNRAHSGVNLPDDNAELTEVRLKLKRLAVVVIPLTI